MTISIIGFPLFSGDSTILRTKLDYSAMIESFNSIDYFSTLISKFGLPKNGIFLASIFKIKK